MKTRQGFVSNSSSSSFVILCKDITDEQVDFIRNHITLASMKGWQPGYTEPEDEWSISYNGTEITGSTSMTNFDMEAFFDKIGINRSVVDWEG